MIEIKDFKCYMSILLCLLLFTPRGKAQTIEYRFGSFKGAKSFAINDAGFIYVSDRAGNEIIKMDTLGTLLKSIGGYGWSESSFDEPTDLFANTLNLYVADKNNDRVQIFDKDLNYLFSLADSDTDGRNSNFRYPLGVAVYSQGDLFILDSDNSRVLKYDFTGNFLMEIGGREAGEFALSSPTKLAIVDNSRLAVIDRQQLVFFDIFGNNLFKLNLDAKPVNINATRFGWTISFPAKIDLYVYNSSVPGEAELKRLTPQLEEEIEDSFLFGGSLYILTQHEILKFRLE